MIFGKKEKVNEVVESQSWFEKIYQERRKALEEKKNSSFMEYNYSINELVNLGNTNKICFLVDELDLLIKKIIDNRSNFFRIISSNGFTRDLPEEYEYFLKAKEGIVQEIKKLAVEG